MLKSLQTTNFRKLNDHVFTFTEGLNVIRAINEAGKSTMLEAILYALFGVKACRTPLSEVATWGTKAAEVTVKLVISIDSIDYVIKRSAAGAELNYYDGIVTGQTEVSNFIAAKLGVTVHAATRLMLSSQNDIRGSLAGNDSETVKLIESLAQLDVIDKVGDLVKQELPTGSDSGLKATRSQWETELASLTNVSDDVYNTATAALVSIVQDVDAKEAELLVTQKNLREVSDKANTIQQQIYASLRYKETEQLYLKSLDDAIKNVGAFKMPPEPQPDDDIEAAEQACRDADNYLHNRALAERGARLNAQSWGISGNVYDNDLQLSRLIEINDDTEIRLAKVIEESKIEIARLEAGIITASACGICGKFVSELPEVIKKNGESRALIEHFLALIEIYEQQSENCRTENIMHMNDMDFGHQCQHFVQDNLGYFRLTQPTQFPSGMEWIGPPAPEVPPDAAACKARLASLRNKLNAWNLAAVRQDALLEQVEFIKQRLADFREEPAPPEPDMKLFEQLDSDIAAYSGGHSAITEEIKSLKTRYKVQQDEVGRLARAREKYDERKVELECYLVANQKDVKNLATNNALLKRLRELRPLVANHLWNEVLSTVSNYFSAMRGQDSVVAKDASGFKVDGQSIGGLSGSTLDALGLAVRLALSKKFAAHVGFIVLDEPFSGCDEDRTANALAFVASSGFNQILLVTHESISESLASNLITL